MGLDQYLYAVPRGTHPDEHEERIELMYWRKANEIHRWFLSTLAPEVDEDEMNCVPLYVPAEALAALVQTCERVILEPDLAEELLPTHSGFFYGSLEYDEYYFEDLRKTVEELRASVLNNQDVRGMDLYYYGWW